MSELFDSLNCNGSAGPSSSQSSSQPSASKVYWHASPSPGILHQLRNWAPSKDQGSPTLPLCTQAFVGELRKLPANTGLQSPLVSKSGAKRKLTAGFGPAHLNGIGLSDDDDDHDDDHDDGSDTEKEARNAARRNGKNKQGAGSRRLVLGGIADMSPESRRIVDAGSTGRLREVSPDSLSTTSGTSRENTALLSSKRSDRRPARRRKKESFISGLGLSDNQSNGTDCFKLFEDLQAAIHDMNSNTLSQSNKAEAAIRSKSKDVASPPSHRPLLDARLTPRGFMSRTTSAPSLVEHIQHAESQQVTVPPPAHATQQPAANGTDGISRRIFTSTKSDHDVFRSKMAENAQRQALQPTTNVLSRNTVVRSHANQHLQVQDLSAQAFNATKHASVSPDIVPRPNDDGDEVTHVKHAHAPVSHMKTTDTAAGTNAQVSPVKRSARIEAMHQHTTSMGKKLGVRSRTESPAKPQASRTSTVSTTARTPQRSRSSGLPGMSQARQPGLPRNSSQFTSSQAQSVGPSVLLRSGPPAGLRAPFRPPARNVHPSTNNQLISPSHESSTTRTNCPQPSSDDSFPGDDDEFLALACELEY